MPVVSYIRKPQVEKLEAEFHPPPASLPLVSVIVACMGQLQYTRNLVASLEQHAGCDYELILVDNGCPEGTAEWARKHSIQAIKYHANQGVPVAYNAGVEKARGGILALWNNDMVCHPHGLRRLAEATFARGMAAQSGGTFNSEGEYAGCTGDAKWADSAEGYALAFQREVWEKTGVWDTEIFPSYGDDTDWTLRARLQGYDFRLVPDVVTHFGQKTSGAMHLNPIIRKHQQLIRDRYLQHGLGQRTLVIRYAAAGDILMTTPILRALKREAPLGRLHVFCHPGAGSVLAGNPHVDARCDGSIRPQDYTRLIDLTNAYEGGQKRRVWEHPVRAYAERAGVELDGGRYDFYVPESLRVWASDLLPEVPFQQIACGIRSGTRNKQNWRASGWLELAEALYRDRIRLVALDSAPRPPLGSHGPSPDDERFYDHPNVLDLTGQTDSMHHAGALIERCSAFIGVDSALLHVAAALGKPVVNVCAAAPMDARLPLVGQADGFEGVADCFPCQYKTPCPERSHCLDWVRGEWVSKKIREMVDSSPRRHGDTERGK